MAAVSTAEADAQAAKIIQHFAYALDVRASKEDYQQVVDMMKQLVITTANAREGSAPQESEQLAVLLHSLAAVSSLLNDLRHEALLQVIYSVDVWAVDAAVRTSWLRLLEHLVTVKSTFLQPCIDRLVKSFLPTTMLPSITTAAAVETGAEEAPGARTRAWVAHPQVTVVHTALCASLAHLISHVPRCAPLVRKAVAQCMPHKLQTREVQCIYFHAAYLLVSQPAGDTIRDSLLTDIVDHLVSIDVEIKWEDVVDRLTGQEEEEGSSDDEEEDMFGMEDNVRALALGDRPAADTIPKVASCQGSGWEGAARNQPGSTSTSAPAAAAQTQLKPSAVKSLEMADKLDALMAMTLTHMASRAAASPVQVQRLWDAALAAFQHSILLTHRAKFTPYIVFAAAVRTRDGGADFVQLLVSRICDTAQPPVVRTTCAAYAASFLARSNFTPLPVVLAALTSLCDFATRYSSLQSSRNDSSTSSRNGSSSKVGGVLNAAAPRPMFRTSISNNAHPSNPSNTAGNAGVSSTNANLAEQRWGGAQAMRRRATMPALSELLNVGRAADDSWMRHEVFYAVCQVVLYVLCYHLSALDGVAQPQALLNLKAIVSAKVLPLLHSPLQPLHICLPTVAREFAKQLALLKLDSIDHLLPAALSDGTAPRARRPLEMFFPYDPYLLPISKECLNIEATYRHWRDGHVVCAAAAAADDELLDSDDDDDEGDDESSSSDDSDADEHAGASPSDAGMRHVNPFSCANTIGIPARAPFAPRTHAHAYAAQQAAQRFGGASLSDTAHGQSFSSAGDVGMSPDGHHHNFLGAMGTSPGDAAMMSCTPDVSVGVWGHKVIRASNAQ